MQSSDRRYESARQIERQARILTCAREMLDESGYEGLIIRDLAKRAGVAVATIYNLYGTKDGVILESLKDLFDQLEQEIQRRVSDDPVADLIMSCEVMKGQIQQTPQYAAAMTRAALMANDNPALTQTMFGRDIPFYYECLSRLEAQKKLKGKFDLEELAKQFSAHSWGLVIFWMTGHIELDEVVNQRVWAMKLMLAGVVTETVGAGLLK